jgi:hypothetical protein
MSIVEGAAFHTPYDAELKVLAGLHGSSDLILVYLRSIHRRGK